MKKAARILGLSVIAAVIAVSMCASIVWAADSGSMGPAPNSHDGVSDGSGFDTTNGPNGDVGSGSGPVGPAPNSGDGVSDGSGF